MLDANLKTQLTAYLERVTRPIQIHASIDDIPKAREMLELLEDLVLHLLDQLGSGLGRVAANLQQRQHQRGEFVPHRQAGKAH